MGGFVIKKVAAVLGLDPNKCESIEISIADGKRYVKVIRKVSAEDALKIAAIFRSENYYIEVKCEPDIKKPQIEEADDPDIIDIEKAS